MKPNGNAGAGDVGVDDDGNVKTYGQMSQCSWQAQPTLPAIFLLPGMMEVVDLGGVEEVGGGKWACLCRSTCLE